MKRAVDSISGARGLTFPGKMAEEEKGQGRDGNADVTARIVTRQLISALGVCLSEGPLDCLLVLGEGNVGGGVVNCEAKSVCAVFAELSVTYWHRQCMRWL